MKITICKLLGIMVLFAGLNTVLFAAATVEYHGGPGPRNVIDQGQKPLAPGNEIRIGYFPTSFDLSKNIRDLNALKSAWKQFHSTTIMDIPVYPGIFGADFSNNDVDFDGKKIYLWAFKTQNATPVAIDYSNVLEYGLYSANTNSWIFPPVAAQPPRNYTLLSSSEIDEVFWGSFNNESLILAPVESLAVNHAPVLAAIADQAINEGDVLQLQTSATDSDGPGTILTFSLEASAPNGMHIDPVTGKIIWATGEVDGPATNLVQVRVTDNGVPPLSDAKSFNVVVREVNSNPVLAPIPTQHATVGQLLRVLMSANDADIPAQKLAFSIDGQAPVGLLVDGITGVLTWTPASAQALATNLITVRVTDNGEPSLSAQQSFSIIVESDNHPPSLVALPVQTVNELSQFTVTNVATDVDLPPQKLTFSLEPGVPVGATIDPVSGVFAWTPTEMQGPGTNTITVKVTDNGVPNYSATNSFVVVVKEVNSAPVLIVPETQVIKELTTLLVTNLFSDSDIPTNNLTLELVSAPAGLTLNSTNGVVTWTPTEAQGPSTNVILLKLSDNGVPALSVTNQFTVVVEEVNSAPLMANIPDQSIPESNLFTYQATAMDADLPANTLVFSLGAGAPPAMSIDPVTGVINWAPTEADGPGTTTITVKVTDNGNPVLSDTKSFTLTVQEVNRPPVFTLIDTQRVDKLSTLVVTNMATDPDLPANRLVYTLLTGPPGATLNLTNGILTWTPTAQQGPSTNMITVKVDDDGAPPMSATNSFVVLVADVNSPPVLVVPNQITIKEMETLMVTNKASDSDIPANQLTFSLVSPPAGMGIDPRSGVIVWTPEESQGPATYTIVVKVTDNGVPPLSTTNSFNVVVKEVNTPPILSPISNRTIDVGTMLVITNQATDSDLPANRLKFYIAAGPDGANLDEQAGILTWTPTDAQGGTTNYFRILVADDGFPVDSDSQQFIVVVKGTVHPPKLVLQTSLSVAGVFNDESQAVVNETTKTITIDRSGSTRFYRLRAQSSIRIRGIQVTASQVILKYE